MRVKPGGLCLLLLALGALPVSAQRLSDFITPQPLPEGAVLAVGFLGGFEHWNDEHRGVRKLALDLRERGIFAETASNHRRETAVEFVKRALDRNGDGHIDAGEAARARVILYGQSWGGAAVVQTARELEQWGVQVLLTVQIDSVGLHDGEIPANVLAAVNFYQHDLFTIRGRREIHAADPTHTHILGNFGFSYYFRPVDEADASWARRTFGGGHAKMELDPMVWQQVEQLVFDAARY